MAVHFVSIRPSDCSRVSRGPFCGVDDIGPREREEDEEEDDEEEETETSRDELGSRVLSVDWQTPAYILHARRGHIYWHLCIRSMVETYCAPGVPLEPSFVLALVRMNKVFRVLGAVTLFTTLRGGSAMTRRRFCSGDRRFANDRC